MSVSIRFGGVTTKNKTKVIVSQSFIQNNNSTIHIATVAVTVAYTNGKMSSRPPAVARQTCTVSEQFRAVGTTPARQTYPETGRESPRDRIVTSLCRCEAIDVVLSSSMVALQPRA